MIRIKSFFTVLFFTILWFSACSQNDDQRDFERKAFSSPGGYTQTDPNSGQVINEDPDDWRISPFFQGLVRIEPAFPNPANSDDEIRINFYNDGIESVSGLRVWAFYEENGEIRPLGNNDVHGELPVGLQVINFEGTQVARFSENPQGLYRVILLDGNENVISYGDIRIN